MSGKSATITIREGLGKRIKSVVLGSDEKPELSREKLSSWQSLLNTAAKIVNVPSALIMRLHQSEIEVLLGNEDKESPYKPGDREKLNHGLYCETVVGTQKELLVPDATIDPIWKSGNPDIPLGMISYFGLPINWPDGEVFGTICLLDKKENHYSETYRDFLLTLKQHIEDDLRMLVMDRQLKAANEKLHALNVLKTQFLSIISHDIRGGLGTSNELLKLIINQIDQSDQARIKKLLGSVSQHIDTTYSSLVDLLLWSKTDMLELQPDKKPQDLVEILEQVLAFYKPAMDQKQLRLVRAFDQSPSTVFADKNMLKAIFRNVLSNAIKHSDPGGKVVVRIKAGDLDMGASQDPAAAHNLVVEIEDEGAGMNQEVLDRLLSGPVSAASPEGVESSAGLGLLIAKDFLDMQSIRTEIKSEPGKGTMFRVMF